MCNLELLRDFMNYLKLWVWITTAKSHHELTNTAVNQAHLLQEVVVVEYSLDDKKTSQRRP